MNMREQGQVVIGAIILLVIMAISVPTIMRLVQQDGKQSTKQQLNVTAAQLAETAVERGYQYVITSTITWTAAVTGVGIPTGYNFDQTYTDTSGGVYQVRIAAANSSEIDITGVGRDKSGNEVRAIKARYSRTSGGAPSSSAIIGGFAMDMSTNTFVEWGRVWSLISLSGASQNHPRYQAVGFVTPKDTNLFLSPNTDGIQWWSWYLSLPPMPSVDNTYYQNIAQAYPMAPPAGCPAAYRITSGGATFQGCQDPNYRAYVINGNVVFNAGGAGNCIKGTIVVIGGTITINGDAGGNCGAIPIAIPSRGWQEYGNDWAFYQTTFDPAAPASFALATSSNYQSGAIYAPTNLFFHGFLIGGNITQNISTGLRAKMAGVIFSLGIVDINGAFTYYYDSSVATGVQTIGTQATVSRTSWKNLVCSWGTAAASATCP